MLSFAPLPAIMLHGGHRPAGAHIVFAFHLYAFVLILLSVAVLLAQANVLWGGEVLHSGLVDKLLSLFNLLVCGVYIYLAIPRVYRTFGWRRFLSSVLLTFAVAFLFVGYRFAVFLITFYTT